MCKIPAHQIFWLRISDHLESPLQQVDSGGPYWGGDSPSTGHTSFCKCCSSEYLPGNVTA